MRDVLFVHGNFPGQFMHLALSLAERGDWRIFAVGGETARVPPTMRLERYDDGPIRGEGSDAAMQRWSMDHARGLAVAKACQRLKADHCEPALIVGHAGWGEMLYVRDVFPAAPVLSYLEFYFAFAGADVNFDPASRVAGLEAQARVRSRNAPALFAAVDSDALVSPTLWQASRFPDLVRQRIEVIHEGIDTDRAAPSEIVRVEIEDGRAFKAGDEVITFVARNLEPYRGFHVFMRALPEILERRPNAHVLIVGDSGTSYGPPPSPGRTWKSVLLKEVGRRLDRSRVHFLGRLPYDAFLGVLQVSRVHVYLTYPFVLSWSLLEAMSCGALVVASRTAPVEEVIKDGENGVLVDFFDEPGLATAVVSALAEPEALHPLRQAARRTVLERYDLRRVCLPRMLSLVRRLTGD
ncbi:MAG: glycosyltransferase [Alsobacter sp.]